MNKKYFVFAIVAVLALMVSACGPSNVTNQYAAPEALRTLNVNGVGVVYLTPDIAYITIGVNTQRDNASEAVDANKEQTAAVIQAIKDAGVEDKDIRTNNFSIWSNPQYDSSGQLSGVINYSVDNTVNVTVRNIDKLGDLLDAAITAGANSIYSIQFDVEDKSKAQEEARTKAVEDAKAEAAGLAETSGVALDMIQNISYYESGGAYYYDMGYGKGGGGAGVEAAAVPIQPGQLAVTVSVNITYTIK
ncbi:MAG: putative periplasmic immunogenic protein [Chloroflexi bacterium OLB14]|nr:MAG: putative periplasmic immunogenic protein [Chloroflexi bacterium OLB14]